MIGSRLRALRWFAALLAPAVFAVGEARAQHCWPTMVGLVVRDSTGAVLQPEALEHLSYAPLPGASADFAVHPWRLAPYESAGLSRSDSLPVLLWAGQGDCRVEMREVVLRHGGREMRLLLDVRLDSDRAPGFSEYLIDLPPFAPGTWRLDLSPLPTRRPAKGPIFIPATHWRRVAGPDRPASHSRRGTVVHG